MTKTPHLHAKAKRCPTTHFYAPPHNSRGEISNPQNLFVYIYPQTPLTPPPPPFFYISTTHPPTSLSTHPPHIQTPAHQTLYPYHSPPNNALPPKSHTPNPSPQTTPAAFGFPAFVGLCTLPQSINQSPWSNPADGMISVCCM